MARYFIPKTYTLTPDQVVYIEESVGDLRREQSRWMRETVQMRIAKEMKDAGAKKEPKLRTRRPRAKKVD